MSAIEVVEMLKSLGGYGVAGLMYYMWQLERKERTRYRDHFEAVLKEIPRHSQALERLTNEITQLARTNPTLHD